MGLWYWENHGAIGTRLCGVFFKATRTKPKVPCTAAAVEKEAKGAKEATREVKGAKETIQPQKAKGVTEAITFFSTHVP